ncbi:MAG: alpha/beta hydrolase [Microthrixaceae bacterium]|nr:alpha/beta hydrolase [Microthrixaceae bacterium]
MTPVTLNTTSWGRSDAPRRALLVHGLGSNGPLMWRFGVTLADAGWHATAVDLRGHGLSPRALDYTIEAHAVDLGATTPEDGAPWDLVIGHSLGGASSIVAAAADPDWARRLVLIDPAVIVTTKAQGNMRNSMAATAAETLESVRAANPSWHETDVELKVLSVQQGSPWAVAQSNMQNQPWDVRAAASRLTVPTHVIAGDPAVMSIFAGALADEVLANPAFSMAMIEGAGHSPHRDKPEATMAELLRSLEG